mmetsp:Transcript_17862/g.48056  ORF Transcript_17862/g.48056 Transcript_17862/m.48056 type:complete len:406 (-) Transcript_17862:436-1653(-)
MPLWHVVLTVRDRASTTSYRSDSALLIVGAAPSSSLQYRLRSTATTRQQASHCLRGEVGDGFIEEHLLLHAEGEYGARACLLLLELASARGLLKGGKCFHVCSTGRGQGSCLAAARRQEEGKLTLVVPSSSRARAPWRGGAGRAKDTEHAEGELVRAPFMREAGAAADGLAVPRGVNGVEGAVGDAHLRFDVLEEARHDEDVEARAGLDEPVVLQELVVGPRAIGDEHLLACRDGLLPGDREGVGEDLVGHVAGHARVVVNHVDKRTEHVALEVEDLGHAKVTRHEEDKHSYRACERLLDGARANDGVEHGEQAGEDDETHALLEGAALVGAAEGACAHTVQGPLDFCLWARNTSSLQLGSHTCPRLALARHGLLEGRVVQLGHVRVSPAVGRVKVPRERLDPRG